VTAVNTEVMMPMMATAKRGWSGAEMHHQRGSVVLVMVASKMAVEASYSHLQRVEHPSPSPEFLAERSLISTLASTAAPIVGTKPAMPGGVSRVEHRHDAQDHQRVDQQRDRGMNADRP
jgi:hypothetical protein